MAPPPAPLQTFPSAKCLRPAGTRAPPAGHSSSSYIANILFQIQNTKYKIQKILGHILGNRSLEISCSSPPCVSLQISCSKHFVLLLLGNRCKHLVSDILSSSYICLDAFCKLLVNKIANVPSLATVLSI